MIASQDLTVFRCAEPECNGAHIIVVLGHQGQPEMARHVTDAAGARNIAAMLCEAAADIERVGLAAKPN